tara:strand:+ start:738 stop:1496 length:759 start_codon:yes stop_codon:yes gene_type:complete
MHKYIVNPETGRRVSILGKTGQNVLKKYSRILNGGSINSKRNGLRKSRGHNWTYDRLQKVQHNIKKIIDCDKLNISEIVSECGVSVLQLIEIKKCFKWMDHTFYTNTNKKAGVLNILINNLNRFINTITKKKNQSGGFDVKPILLHGLKIIGSVMDYAAIGNNQNTMSGNIGNSNALSIGANSGSHLQVNSYTLTEGDYTVEDNSAVILPRHVIAAVSDHNTNYNLGNFQNNLPRAAINDTQDEIDWKNYKY